MKQPPKTDAQKKDLINRTWMTKSEQRSLVTKKAIYGLTPTEISVLTALITINNVGKDLKTANAELPFIVKLAKVAHRTGHSEAAVGRCSHHIAELGLLTILPDSGRENRYRLHLAPMYDWKPSTEKTKKQIASATNAEAAREIKRLNQQVEDDAAAEQRRACQLKFIQNVVQAGQESDDTKAFREVMQQIKESGERRYSNIEAWNRMKAPAPPGTFLPDPVQQLPKTQPPHQDVPIHTHYVQPVQSVPIQPEPPISDETRSKIAELRAMPKSTEPIREWPAPLKPGERSTDHTMPAPVVRLYKPPYEK